MTVGISKNFVRDASMEVAAPTVKFTFQYSTKKTRQIFSSFRPGLEDAAAQSRLTYDRMSAEESRLFPDICKGDVNRHKIFLTIRNNIVRRQEKPGKLSNLTEDFLCFSYECGSTSLEFS